MNLLSKFDPPDERSVRRTGLRNAFLGLVLMVFGVMVVLSLDRLAHGTLLDPTAPKPSKLRAVSGVPVVIGFVAILLGLYRAITGIHPARDGRSIRSTLARLLTIAAIGALLVGGIAAIAAATLRAPGPAP